MAHRFPAGTLWLCLALALGINVTMSPLTGAAPGAAGPEGPGPGAGAVAGDTPTVGGQGVGVLQATGVNAGLAVHVGCGDGALVLDLARTGQFVVQGLSLQADPIAAARLRADAAGLTGLAVFDPLPTTGVLPYNDNLVSLLVADLDALGKAAPARDEILRVLSPWGAAWLKSQGQWAVVKKPLPATMGQWTHHDHAPDGNAQSPDSLVDMPRGVQWFVSGGGSMTSELRLAGGIWVQSGRLSTADRGTPNYLDGRNAFNGLLLWRRAEDRAASSARGLMDSSFCTDGKRVYGILDDATTAKAWDLATGREIMVYTQGLKNREPSKVFEFRNKALFLQNMIVSGKLIQVSGLGGDEPDAAVLDAESGKRLWD